jgi:histidinol-phosphate aminotransferase
MTAAMGVAILMDEEYTRANCRMIMDNRAFTVAGLEKLGFRVLDSGANFIFVSSDRISGGDYYRAMKEKGILIRHFTKERIDNWCRVSIGSRESMEAFLKTTGEILAELKD